MKVLLFDIDGTLVLSGGAGMRAMNQAFEELYGVPSVLDGISLSGRTDSLIIQDAFDKAEIDMRDADLEHYKKRYFELIPAEMQMDGTSKRMMPGIEQIIPELAAREHITLGLLTGNWETSGRVKIDYFGLDQYFAFGAFADDSSHRPDLVPIAMQRYTAHTGRSVEPKDVYVIGDTPHDVTCAKPSGAVSVAVAAASHSMETLKTYEPDFLFADLSDIEKVLEVLG